MGTPALIGALNEDGSVQAISVNHDGYPKEAGRKLITYWATFPRVQALLALGDLAILGEEIGEAHRMDPFPRVDMPGMGRWCVSFMRDRIPYLKPGEKEEYLRNAGDETAQIYDDVREFLDAGDRGGSLFDFLNIEWAYLYEGGQWYVYPDCELPRYLVAEYLETMPASLLD